MHLFRRSVCWMAVVLVNMRATGAIDVDLGVPAASWLPPLPRDAAVWDVCGRAKARARPWRASLPCAG